MLSRSAFQCQRPGAISSTAGAYRDPQRSHSPARPGAFAAFGRDPRRAQPVPRSRATGLRLSGALHRLIARTLLSASSTAPRTQNGHIRNVSGTQIHPSCCSGVFVDQSAESVASVELVWRVRTDEVWARPWYRWCQPESAMRPVGVVVVDVDA